MIPNNPLTLYEIEASLIALLDTEDAGVPEELRQQFAQELAAYSEAALVKRDKCAQFVRWVEGQIEFAKQEESRLYDRRKRLESGLERFKRYVVGVVDQFASDMRKGPRRLEGRTATLVAVKNPDSVEIVDAQQLPLHMVHLMFRVPGQVIAGLPEDVRSTLKRNAVEYGIIPLKQAIAAAFRAHQAVPGARLREGDKRLDIR